MKFSSIALTFATAGSLVAAQPHRHHRHVGKRSPAETEVVTVVAYELDGKPISSAEVFAGIADKKLVWADGAPVPASETTLAPSSPSPEPSAPAPAPSSAGPDVGAQFYQKPESSSAPAPSTSAAASTYSSSSGSSSSWTGSSSSKGLDQDFPDGELDCSTFPSEYGAIEVDWLGLGGWTGIQYVTIAGSAFTIIKSADPGGKCIDGAMCSYACPAGYQKSQWPSAQGVNGESVGGISCSGGKLRLTNPSFKQLCIKGTGIVNVENKLGSNVAICRTDYPGTESETVPLDTPAGSTNPLTCPNGNEYYRHLNAYTSAQYYVNPEGVPVQNACRWDSGTDQGNKAPVNLGVGTKNGQTFIGLFQNHPTTNGTLKFDVEIVGDNLGGKCRYHNGTYYDHNGGNIAGCTVEVMSGTATYVFTPWS